MKFLVTGANGFLGRYVVAEALRRRHSVRALVRSADDGARHGWDGTPGVELAVADLRSRVGLLEAVRGVDCVLHLAAAKAGDLYAQYAGTVVATENLLWAMLHANVSRIVGISSFSVYDYLKIRSYSVLTEESPVEVNSFARDEYAHTKLVQERIIREAAERNGWTYTILRPGVIWGKDNLWTARLGVQASKKLWIRTGAWARLPLTYVENCAEAIILAAEKESAKGETLNVVDDEMPTQRHYMKLLQGATIPRPRVLPVAWSVMRFLAGAATVSNRLLFKRRAKVPGIFVPARLHARCKPLRFSNEKIKDVLGWTPRYSLDVAMQRAVNGKPITDAAMPSESGQASLAEVVR